MGSTLTPQDVVRMLNLSPLPGEGGMFRQTYKSTLTVSTGGAEQSERTRAAGTAIYYLITAEDFSSLHRVKNDEVFHFYLGDPVELMLLNAAGECHLVRLGSDIAHGEHLQAVVRAGVWQGLRVASGGKWALLGATVSPGFEFEDFEVGERAVLSAQFPAHRQSIERYTR